MDKLRLLYRQTGRAAWVSHLDMMRLLQRAMNRADIPIRYSEGFNPHALISIVMPLSVGTESLCQMADIRVKSDVELDTLPAKLSAVMPEGFEVTDVWEDGAKCAELKWLRAECRWEYDLGVTEELSKALRAFFSRESIVVTRKTKRGEGPFDIRPQIRELSLTAGEGSVTVTGLFSAAEPVIKPELLAKAVSENCPELAPDACLCRRIELLNAEGKPFR